MTTRNFNNVATVGTLAGPLASSATSATLSNFNSTPTVPFTATIDRNTATEEIVLVTALLGGTATLTRGYDGTSAQAHSAGALIEHTAGAIEYNEANHHVNTTVNVHGSTGNVVGDQGSQTLFDKTLVSPVLQANVTSGDAAVAYIPPGAETKNMYTGINSSGVTKFSVSSSGGLDAATLHSTGNTTVSGALAVTGTTALTGAVTATGAATITGAANLNGGATVPSGKTLTVNGTSALATTTTTGLTSSTAHVTGATTLDGALTVSGQVKILNSGDVGLTQSGAAVQFGPDTGTNTTWDGNEMAARVWNGSAYTAGSFGMTASNVGITGSATVGVQGTSASSVVRKDYVDTQYASGTFNPPGGWTGNISWARAGKVVTVSVRLLRTSSLTVTAWDYHQLLGSGLPARDTGGFDQVLALAADNRTEAPGFQFATTGAGTLYLQARWQDRTLVSGNWVHGSFSYVAA